MLEVKLNAKEQRFLEYMAAGIEPRDNEKLEFMILAGQINRAFENDYKYLCRMEGKNNGENSGNGIIFASVKW